MVGILARSASQTSGPVNGIRGSNVAVQTIKVPFGLPIKCTSARWLVTGSPDTMV
jgi:hypothetical protein